MAAFGFQRKEILEADKVKRIRWNAPFAFAIGKNYKTNKAFLYEIHDAGLHIRIPHGEAIPDLTLFANLPMAFRLPNDQTTWNCNVDIERIYAYDEKDSPLYGLEVKFKNLTKEQNLQYQNYLQNIRNANQQRASLQQKSPAVPPVH
ncbi:hypothetical protein JW926_11135 [Candidatus Sumerlaeota bacterium]|nr:hypothetical protein [Candidatus Sumerlaeota bacterium]